ncbi:epoxide hydrolase N-terminal domain-containing protein, partial [Paraburkholderia ginsengiterrae]|uniref:epoxide hydrolase N-terminal domain-containing protein n=1 Tax=Paraburkholderia ginsengiterrae TaxID=1462993 RepID=UPI003133AF06
MRDLAEYWARHFDWLAAQRTPNRHPHSTAHLHPQRVPFVPLLPVRPPPYSPSLLPCWPGPSFHFPMLLHFHFSPSALARPRPPARLRSALPSPQPPTPPPCAAPTPPLAYPQPSLLPPPQPASVLPTPPSHLSPAHARHPLFP